MLPAQLDNATSDNNQSDSHYHDNANNPEPPAQPERRQHSDRNTCTHFIPNAFAISGDHSERVVAGREVGKVGGAVSAGLAPLVIQAVQPVSEFDLFRFDGAQRRVADLEVS